MRAKGLAVLAVPIAALLAALAAAYWVDGLLGDAVRDVLRVHESRADLGQMRRSLVEADSALNAYLVTGRRHHLEILHAARKSVGDSQSRLSSEPGIVPPMREIRSLIASEMDALDRVERGADPSGDWREKPLLDLLSRIDLFDRDLEQRLAQARRRHELARQDLLRAVSLCAVVGSLGALLVHLLISRSMVRRLRKVEENARRLGHGQPLEPASSGSDEIATLARQIESSSYLLGEREREVRESERRYRDLFDHAPLPYEETDRRGVITRFNQAMSRLMKCAPDQLIGRPVWDFVVPDQQEPFRSAMMARMERGEETDPFECGYLLDDGTHITVEVRENLIRNPSGEVTGTVRSLLDVTQRNLAAVAARKVEQYAMELRIKNEQLARALEGARAASVAKGRFLANVSHELRTPLNGIIGFSELLYHEKLGPLAAEQRDVQRDVLASARHLLQLINDILDFSKVEAGRMEFRPEPHDVRALVVEVRDVLRPLADKKALSVDVDAPAGLIAQIDGGRFKQVLYNYLSNAVKFTPDGGQIIARILPEGDRFRLEVEDTGVGIAQSELPRLFQEFSQLPNSRQVEQGTGLGLALTKHLVEAQGGSVGVQSELGRGSIFFAVLPLEPLTRVAANS